MQRFTAGPYGPPLARRFAVPFILLATIACDREPIEASLGHSRRAHRAVA